MTLEAFLRALAGREGWGILRETCLCLLFCCSSRSANEEPRKETEEVKYSGEWWLVVELIPSHLSLCSLLCHSSIWHQVSCREKRESCAVSGPLLQLCNTFGGGTKLLKILSIKISIFLSPIFPVLVPSYLSLTETFPSVRDCAEVP